MFDKTTCIDLNEPLCLYLTIQVKQICDNLFQDLNAINNIINSLYVVVENENILIHDVTEDVFVFLKYIINDLYCRTQGNSNLPNLLPEQVNNYLQHFIRITLALCQKYEPSQDNSCEFLMLSFKICMHPNVTFDTRANCGHIMLIVCKNVTETLFTKEMNKNDIWKEFITLLNNQHSYLKDYLEFDRYESNNVEVTEIFVVCIMLGILKTVPLEILQAHTINNYPVITYFFNELLNSVKRFTCKPTQILEITQAMLLMSNSVHYLGQEELKLVLEDALPFVFSHLNHYMNTIRSNTTAIFINFIKCAKQRDLIGLIIDEAFKLQNSENSFYQVLEVLSKEISCSMFIKKHLSFPKFLLSNLIKTDLANEICACFKNLANLHFHEESRENWVECWISALITFLGNCPEECNKYCHDLFIELFKIDQTVIKTFLLNQKGSENEIIIYLACLLHLRNHGIPLQTTEIYGVNSNETVLWRSLVNYELLEALKFHHNDIIRVSVLALVVESHKSTETFTQWELDFLISYFQKNTSVLSANTRQQIMALGRKMFARYNESMKVLKRNEAQLKNKLKGKEQLALKLNLKSTLDCLESYEKFWFNLFSQVLSIGLHSGANYSRRFCCLELLILSSKVVDDKKWISAWHKENVQHLKGIIETDTYETNKEKAVILSQKIGSDRMGLNVKTEAAIYFKNVVSNLTSLKPADTLSGSYMFDVILESSHVTGIIKENMKNGSENEDKVYMAISFILENIFEAIDFAKNNLKKAAETKPLHGLFLALRHLMKHMVTRDLAEPIYRDILDKCVKACFMVLPIIFQVVCNSSPEGYIPEDSFSKEDETCTAQMLLVYTWRAAKETSLFLGEIALNLPICDSDESPNDGVISVDLMQRIGDFFVDFLMTVKHRGAFEQGYIGFTNYCKRLWRLRNYKLRRLPEMYLTKIMSSLQGKFEHINACATRRSAGLPFMVQAVLTTEPKLEGRLFNQTMKTLLSLAKNEGDDNVEQKVHSLNILKALYKHNQLGEAVTPYVAQGVMIAIRGLSNSSWSIRNSATLLFSSLMTRMFGVSRNKKSISSKNKLTGHVFFMRYPLLYDFLLKQLKNRSKDENCPSLYGILLIFGHLYPGNRNNDSEYKLSVFLPYVEACLSNSVYQTRDLAAAASVAIISTQDRDGYVWNILKKLPRIKTENNRHGLLLQLRYFLENVNVIQKSDLDCFVFLFQYLEENGSDLSKALYLEILFEILKKISDSESYDNSYLKNVFSSFLWSKVHRKGARVLSTSSLKYKIYNGALSLLYSSYVAADPKLLIRQLFSYLIGDDQDLKTFSLKIINFISESNGSNLCRTEKDLAKQCVKLLPIELIDEMNDLIKRTLKIYLLYAFRYLNEMEDADFLVSYFTALRRHVFLLNEVFNSPNDVMEHLLKLCKECKDDLVISSLLAVIVEYLGSLEQKSKLNITKLLNFLECCASPDASTVLKLSVCDFFLDNKCLFYQKDPLLSGSDLIKCWYMVTTLTEDDDSMVRNRISHLAAVPFSCESIPIILPKYNLETIQSAKEKILDHAFLILPDLPLLSYLLTLIFRNSESDVTEDCETSDVFDKGLSNIHSEILLTSYQARNMLKKLLLCKEQAIKNSGELLNVISKLSVAFDDAIISREIKNHSYYVSKTFTRILGENNNNFLNKCQAVIENLENSNLKEFFGFIMS
ncbi:thyroid adenoma-associated protein homolog isoform X2 [Agrilus planipennis]|nr:thyroid adenoma-associated protein homolog isoform X2 [Agrilus planipennis]